MTNVKTAFLVGLGLSLTSCSSPSQTSHNSNYEKGKEMPSLAGLVHVGTDEWEDSYQDKVGVIRYLRGQGHEIVTAFYLRCGIVVESKPFAIINKPTGFVLFDNQPTDGTIDDVLTVKNVGPNPISNYSPNCQI